MKHDYREMMMRALENDLTESEQRLFEKALSESRELAAEWRQVQKLSASLSASKTTAFSPFFSARVMQQIKSQGSESLTDGLLWVFKPLLSAAAVVAIALAISNWSEREILEADASVLEAVFAVAPVTLEASYAMDY